MLRATDRKVSESVPRVVELYVAEFAAAMPAEQRGSHLDVDEVRRGQPFT